MERIIHQNKSVDTLRYYAIALFSLFTLRKVKRVEKRRKEYKKVLIEQQGQKEDPYKL